MCSSATGVGLAFLRLGQRQPPGAAIVASIASHLARLAHGVAHEDGWSRWWSPRPRHGGGGVVLSVTSGDSRACLSLCNAGFAP